MDRAHRESHAIGKLRKGTLEKGTIISRTIDFVYQQLPEWRDDPNRPDESAEDKLSLQLCKFIDSRARDKFPMVRFDHEEYQTGRRRVDLSASPVKQVDIGARIYSIYEPIIVLECKRLPAPSSVREKEYVTGNEERNGGIQRFKIGVHGAKLDKAVMIAYVQEDSLMDWYKKINEWIEELANDPSADVCQWSTDDLLQTDKRNMSNGVGYYLSAHTRTGKVLSKIIKLHHLWINLSKE